MNPLGFLPGVAAAIGSTVSAMGDISIDAAKMQESTEGMKTCDDGAVKADAMQLLEYMRGDKISIFGSAHENTRPGLFVGWQIKNIMEKYKQGSPEYQKLSGCIGNSYMGEIRYRMGRIWWDTVTTSIGLLIALVIVLVITYAIINDKMSKQSTNPPTQSFVIQKPVGGFVLQ